MMVQTETLRAVLYARSACENPSSIAEQLATCRRYAEHRGYIVVTDLVDYGSGLSLELPQLNRIRQLVHEFDVLIVTEITRLSRSPRKFVVIEDELKQAGVRIEAELMLESTRQELRLKSSLSTFFIAGLEPEKGITQEEK